MTTTREHRERSHDSAKASLDYCLLANRFALGQTGSSRRMTAIKLFTAFFKYRSAATILGALKNCRGGSF